MSAAGSVARAGGAPGLSDRTVATGHGRAKVVVAKHGPESSVVHVLPIDGLRLVDSPRLDGINQAHVHLLAELDVETPPVLVHRPSMRLIDGMHRVTAARLKGRTTIRACFFDGDANDAFVLAVKENVTHGLPLTLTDRKAAAARILAASPHASDRSVAGITGLSPKTVGDIRRLTVHTGVSARIGGDGRVRPADASIGRRIAGEVLARTPDASLREIAKQAGISPATVRDVRDRLRRGEGPVPVAQRDGSRAAEAGGRARPVGADRPADRDDRPSLTALMHTLQKDPSLRFTESGRQVLRWLFARVEGIDTWPELVEAIPLHSAYLIAQVAAECADEWAAFAADLRRRLRVA